MEAVVTSGGQTSDPGHKRWVSQMIKLRKPLMSPRYVFFFYINFLVYVLYTIFVNIICETYIVSGQLFDTRQLENNSFVLELYDTGTYLYKICRTE